MGILRHTGRNSDLDCGDHVACMVQAANEGKWVAKECELTELHETSTVRTTVYGSNTVQVYVQSIS